MLTLLNIPTHTSSVSERSPQLCIFQAEHTSVVRALYDYDATAPGELSLHEDDVLYVFDTEDDWLLVQNSKEGGHAGYVPGNYVEVVDENEPPAATTAAVPAPARIIVPDSVSTTRHRLLSLPLPRVHHYRTVTASSSRFHLC